MTKSLIVLLAFYCNFAYSQTIFKASYKLNWGSIYLGKVERQLVKTNNIYSFTSIARPEGFAALFVDSISEKSTFKLHNGRFLSISYYIREGNNKPTIYQYKNNSLLVSGKYNTRINKISPMATDFLGAIYQAMQGVSKGQSRFEFIVYENPNKPEKIILNKTKSEIITVDAGRFDSVLLEKKPTDRTRFKMWLAPKINYLPVKVTNINREGRVFTMSLLSFE